MTQGGEEKSDGKYRRTSAECSYAPAFAAHGSNATAGSLLFMLWNQILPSHHGIPVLICLTAFKRVCMFSWTPNSVYRQNADNAPKSSRQRKPPSHVGSSSPLATLPLANSYVPNVREFSSRDFPWEKINMGCISPDAKPSGSWHTGYCSSAAVLTKPSPPKHASPHWLLAAAFFPVQSPSCNPQNMAICINAANCHFHI